MDLEFPKLVPIPNSEPICRGDGTHLQYFFRLDWSGPFDEGAHPIPPAYRPLTEVALLVPNEYGAEFRRCLSRAEEEFGIPRLFDTEVREFCLDPAISHIEVAFRLLAYCAVESVRRDAFGELVPASEEVFRPGSTRSLQDPLLASAMLWRFWSNQTGSALVPQFARASYLKTVVEVMRANASSSSVEEDFLGSYREASRIEQFLRELERREWRGRSPGT